MNNMAGSLAQFSEIYWPWPIAVYLFLAGLSAGSLIVSVLLKLKNPNENDAIVKSGAVLSVIAIAVGSVMLVFDLEHPFRFFYLLLYYNPTSVMTLGAIAISIFGFLAFLYTCMIFTNKFGFLNTKFMKIILLFISCVVGAYTGVLLSVVVKIPLWNSPVLPILFLISGISSGVAASILTAILFFKNSLNKANISLVLANDTKLILAEAFALAMLFIGLFYGTLEAKNSLDFIFSNYSNMLYFGVIGIGMIVPLILALTSLKNHEYKVGAILLSNICVLIGVFMLRIFIVYAGQGNLGI